MDTAVWLARIFGPFLLILGLWMLFYHHNTHKIMTSIKNTPAIFYCHGSINLLLGLFIINEYNHWDMSLFVLIPLLGWLFLLRGLMILFFPQLLVKCTMNSHSAIRLNAIFPLVFGVLLCWIGF